MQVGGAGLAVIDKAEAGPQFGAEGLIIPLQRGQEQLAKSRLGTYYARRESGGRSLFADGEEKRAQLTDLKVGPPCLLPVFLSRPEPLCYSLLLALIGHASADAAKAARLVTLTGSWLQSCWMPISRSMQAIGCEGVQICLCRCRCLWQKGVLRSGSWMGLSGRAHPPDACREDHAVMTVFGAVMTFHLTERPQQLPTKFGVNTWRASRDLIRSSQKRRPWTAYRELGRAEGAP